MLRQYNACIWYFLIYKTYTEKDERCIISFLRNFTYLKGVSTISEKLLSLKKEDFFFLRIFSFI